MAMQPVDACGAPPSAGGAPAGLAARLPMVLRKSQMAAAATAVTLVHVGFRMHACSGTINVSRICLVGADATKVYVTNATKVHVTNATEAVEAIHLPKHQEDNVYAMRISAQKLWTSHVKFQRVLNAMQQ